MNRIKLLILDVDGTLTDGKVYMGEKGEVMKAFDIKDGYGLRNILPMHEIRPVIITGRKSRILEKRCEELNITMFFQGVDNKLKIFKEIALRESICINETAYVGDDLHDMECMLYIKDGGGILGCPADAVEKIKDICDFVSSKNGGNGAVREFIEFICERQGK
jgi:3-deoxy-D-manno-octulosonate 8-phosphate phosphatase (KDO 8-P phosphatase)